MEKLKEKVEQGIDCCSTFLCGECPYEDFDDDYFKLKCIHKLICDTDLIFKTYFRGREVHVLTEAASAQKVIKSEIL